MMYQQSLAKVGRHTTVDRRSCRIFLIVSRKFSIVVGFFEGLLGWCFLPFFYLQRYDYFFDYQQFMLLKNVNFNTF